MALAKIPYTAEVSHDGRKYTVNIQELEVPKCSNCGAISFDEEANRQISDAFHHEARLLTGERIREGRERLGLNQQVFAELLGISVSTLSRWETGGQIQQRAFDRFLRAVFGLPELRNLLSHDERLAHLGVVSASDITVGSPTIFGNVTLGGVVLQTLQSLSVLKDDPQDDSGFYRSGSLVYKP